MGNVAQRERWVMEERPRAQMKKCVCFTKGPGRVTSLLILEAACIVLLVCVVSDVPLAEAPGSPVQVVIVRTARVSSGEKFRYSSIVLLATLSTKSKKFFKLGDYSYTFAIIWAWNNISSNVPNLSKRSLLLSGRWRCQLVRCASNRYSAGSSGNRISFD